MDRSSIQQTNVNTDLKQIRPNRLRYYRTFIQRHYNTYSSQVHGTFSRREHMTSHRTVSNILRDFKNKSSIISDHYGMKLERNCKKTENS